MGNKTMQFSQITIFKSTVILLPYRGGLEQTAPDQTKKYREQAQSAQHSTSSMRLNISLAKTKRLCKGMAIPLSLHRKRFRRT